MLGLLLLAVLAYLIGDRTVGWYRLRHIKGPWSTRFSDFWIIRSVWNGDAYEDSWKLCKQYGNLVRVAPNYLVCGDPLEVRKMWAVRSRFDRSAWYKGFQFDPPNDTLLSLRDPIVHSSLRSKMAAGYAGKGIVGLEASVDKQIANFINLINTKYLSTTQHYNPVDFGQKCQYLTLDIISTIAFGRTFGFVDADADLWTYIETTTTSVVWMPVFAQVPWLIGVLQSRVMRRFLPSAKDVGGLGKIMGLAKEVVAERFGDEKVVRPDMLGSFVANGLSQREAEAEALVQIIAGADTTATTLRTTLLHLTTSPLAYNKLQAEIDFGAKEARISSPVTDAEAKKLPYLQACIKEGLRILPPITGIRPWVSQHDEVVCGIHIPKGTNVGWCAKTVMRDRKIFGEDADFFSPERWIDAEGEELQAMENTLDFVFGSVRWRCLGRSISILELGKMFVELMRRFDFTVVNPLVPMKSASAGVTMQTDLFLKITARSSTL